jgi:hypothetical protein
MAEPRKEYRARIWVKLTNDLLPSPQLSTEELQALLADALAAGDADSPIASVTVEDPRR